IYTYNDYFKRFLQNQQSKTLPKDDLTKSIRTIAEYYQSKGDYDNAISYFLQAERFDEALKLISDIYGDFSQIGDLQKIDNWFSKLPEELILKYPDTAYLQVFLVLKLNNDLKKTSILINTALNSVMDVKLKIKFTLLKAELIFNYIDMEQIFTELSSYENTCIELELQIQINYVLGKVLYRMGSVNLEKAKKRFETALKIVDENDKDFFRSEIFMYLGNIYQDLGEFEKSLFYRKRSVELSVNVYQKMQVYSNLAGLYIHMGKFSETYTILKEMRNLYKSYQFRSLKRFLIKTEANFYYECGDHEACFKSYDELIKLENSVNIFGYMWYNYLMEGLQQCYTHMPTYALQYFDIAETFIKSGNIYEIFLIDQGRALCLLQINAVKNKIVIENNLTAIFDYYKVNNLKVVQAQVSFYLAVLYLRNDQFETALIFLKTALDPKHQKELISFLERELPLHQDIMDFAVSNNNNKPLIQLVYDKIRNRETYNWLSKDCLKRFASEMDKITDIIFKPFGKTEIYLRGGFIQEDKWIRKKSKILLAYLMCDPEKIHTKDKIMDMFFDDMPADKADIVYHSAIYNIRTALKIYDIKSDKPKRSKDKTHDYNPQYILYEDKTLRLNPDFYYKADNIEFEKFFEKSKLPALSSEEKIKHSINAIEIYKGDFLPGYYDSWCEELRVKYKNMYITLCEELIKMLEAEIRYNEVIKYSELLLKEDKLNDSTHISIINACAKLGNIKMAKSRYGIMLKIYDEELGEKPQTETLEKITLILI
ncbi:MAG: tetratricopeptide repeat protein, partial [Ignavibacteria bacterium]|nr:tetratricopeptide repeat protein [Ignavibacteria bacterium]